MIGYNSFMEGKIFDSIIIGSGPAGLTAAIYNARSGLEAIVIAGDIPGGQLTITTKVDNWPGFPNGIGGLKLMMDIQEQVKNWGVEIKQGRVEKIEKKNEIFEVFLDSGEILNAKAVIVATGAKTKWLGLDNEKELIGKGVCSCATCDGMFFRDKEVAVVGGGNVACKDVDFLSKLAKKVYLIHRRNELRATSVEAKLVMENKAVEKIWDSVVTEIIGKEKLEALRIKNVISGEEKILPVNGLFVAIGREPATGFVKDMVELNEYGYIVVGKDAIYKTMTSMPGIFAAGDCMDDFYRQAIVAAGAGARAGIDVEKWLSNRKK